MKKIFQFIVAGACIAGATSCSDFLEEDNKTGQTADLTYSTASGLKGLDNSAFAYTRAWWGKEAGLGLAECGSDLFLGGGDNKQMSLITYNLTSASSDGANVADDACLDHYWELFYDGVDVCNNLLQYAESNTLITEKDRNKYYGDAYFLRALYYSQMVALWGPLPYNTEPITETNTTPVREPENVVYGKILQDLDKSLAAYKTAGVMTKDDADKAADDANHGSYYAALALKARVALYAASWLGNNSVEGYSNLYQVAQSAAEEVISGSGASFYSRFSDTWNMKNENVLSNKEAIWGVHYTNDLTAGQTSNCIPHRYKTDANGTHLDFSSLITRTGYTRGGSAMLLMFQGLWNNSSVKDLGTDGVKDNCIFVRVLGPSTSTIKSAMTGKDIPVAEQYSPYGRGFQRYLPSLYLWRTLEKYHDTDQRVDGTLLSHYNIPDGLQQNRKAFYPLMGQYMTDPAKAYEKDGNYFNAGDTAVYFSPLDGDSEAGRKQQAWAKNRYRIMFATGGDLPIFDANGNPTTSGPKVSAVYGDDRYNAAKAGGKSFYPGIKKFLDDQYDSNFPTYDISSRDFIVFRLAEMYLIKAEAQLGQNNASGALQTINQLRTARAISGKDNTISGTVTISTILDERAIELCGEFQRWFDLKRTHTLIDRVKQYNAQGKDNVALKHYYRPIPLSQMDACSNVIAAPASQNADGVLQYSSTADGFWQNPGY
jgi:hypothetical protein